MIRAVHPRDFERVVNLIGAMYAEARYKTRAGEDGKINRAKTGRLVGKWIETAVSGYTDIFFKVIEFEGAVEGFIIAERMNDLYTDYRIVIDHFIYVTPNMRRSPQMGKLLKEFVQWAEQTPAVIRVQATAGVEEQHAGQVFEKLGWQECGRVYGKENV